MKIDANDVVPVRQLNIIPFQIEMKVTAAGQALPPGSLQRAGISACCPGDNAMVFTQKGRRQRKTHTAGITYMWNIYVKSKFRGSNTQHGVRSKSRTITSLKVAESRS